MAENLSLEQVEDRRRPDRGSVGAHPDADQSAAYRQAVQRLLERRLQPDRVESDVEIAAAGGLGDLGGEVGVGGGERVAGSDGEGPVENVRARYRPGHAAARDAGGAT